MQLNPVPNKLTPQQLAILQLFSFDMNEGELVELKNVLVDFYHQRLQRALDLICDERNITDEILKEEGKKHRRTTYNKGKK